MVSLDSDYVSPQEVLVHFVTRPSDQGLRRHNKQAGHLAAIQPLTQPGLYHIGQ